ncbi:hypothetical protein MIR68_004585 [Amoeboaphelidium protococcarum]|nr:hypothetical protein MIR68_004585 [Amoeboaphelidium protococcarum]
MLRSPLPPPVHPLLSLWSACCFLFLVYLLSAVWQITVRKMSALCPPGIGLYDLIIPRPPAHHGFVTSPSFSIVTRHRSRVSLGNLDNALNTICFKQSYSVASFRSLNLDPAILATLAANDILIPTEIQSKCIGPLLNRENAIVLAECGSGKTLAILLPLLQNLHQSQGVSSAGGKYQMRSLFISPNNQLARQVAGVVNKFTPALGLTSKLLINEDSEDSGSLYLPPQTDIVVSTFQTLHTVQHLHKQLFSQLQYLLVDEVDLMFGDGERSKSYSPVTTFCNILKFSKQQQQQQQNRGQSNLQCIFACATLPKGLVSADSIVSSKVRNVKVISSSNYHRFPSSLRQEFIQISSSQSDGSADVQNNSAEVFQLKIKELMNIIRENATGQKMLVFCNSVSQVDKVHQQLGVKLQESPALANITVDRIHSRIQKSEKSNVLQRFVDSLVQETSPSQIIVTGDVLSRGVDFDKQISKVVQFDFATNAINYMHRAGRTARANREGELISFVTDYDKSLAQFVMAYVDEQYQKVSIGEKPQPAVDVNADNYRGFEKLFSRKRSLRDSVKRKEKKALITDMN